MMWDGPVTSNELNSANQAGCVVPWRSCWSADPFLPVERMAASVPVGSMPDHSRSRRKKAHHQRCTRFVCNTVVGVPELPEVCRVLVATVPAGSHWAAKDENLS